MSARGADRVRWWRRWTLRDVIFLTLPPMALVIWVFVASVAEYRSIRKFDDWWSAATSVRKFGFYRLRNALRTFERTSIEARLSAEREDVPQLRLFVDRAEFDTIDGDVGAHFGEWIDAQIEDHGGLVDAELRFRGDGSAHWGTPKKSLTIKTKRDELYKGFRTMAFSVKDVLPQYLVGTIAKDFGLLAPEQQVVPVFLNDRFYGLHRFIEPIDESFLRRNLRMPGNVFRADTAERGDYFKGLPREVFKNPYIWDRVANNDRPGAFGTQLLGEWLADLNTSTPEGLERFMSWHDRDELARLLAFLLVVGDPYHMSGVHNQFWYEDPASGLLHPVVWDVRLLDLEKPPRGSNINHFWRQALREPGLWRLTMIELAKQLEGDQLYEKCEQRLRFVAERYADAIAFDQLREGEIPPIGDVESTLATLRKNIEILRGWTRDSKVSYLAAPSDDGRLWVIDLVIAGRAPIGLEGFDGRSSGNASPMFDRFCIDSNGNGRLDETDEVIGYANLWDAGAGFFQPPVPLGSSVGGMGPELVPVPQHVRLFWKPELTQGTIVGVSLRLVNLATGGNIAEPELQRDTELPMTRVRWELTSGPRAGDWTRSPDRPIELSGAIHLTEDLLVSEHESLVIQPGTILTLEPDVSIESRGRVTALGTEEQPIVIQRANPMLPWGVFALQGKGANDSRFDYVKFLGGGARQVGRVEYKGAVCVHYALDVVFHHCEFAHNQRCDDLINVVKGHANITYSHFHDANADSIDYDMSGGLVAMNRIENSGNDGLDLMTCWPRVVGNQILNSSDKGISIGENSAPLVFANLVDGCERGIEAKDSSAPLVLHSTLSNNRVAIYSHNKNWRYGEAGWPKLVRSTFVDNGEDYRQADGARITLAETRFGALSHSPTNADELGWALRAAGVKVFSSAAGVTDRFEQTEPIAPAYQGVFEANFSETRDHWTMTGGTRRLFKRDHDLIANLARERGGFALDVEWDLSEPTLDYVLVLELAGNAVEDVQAMLTSDAGLTLFGIELAPEVSTYHYVTLPLGPARYSRLELLATPLNTTAQLRLHSWRVFEWPSEAKVK